jgi:hypothetical protein
MTTLVTKLKHSFIVLGVVIIGIALLIVFIPFIPVVLVYASFEDKIFIKGYNEYLEKINGTKYFCYNNRKNSINFIEENILPKLGSDVKIIFLNGTTPESEYERRYISAALYKLKDKRGFPYLLKVRNNKIIDKSINNVVYNTINQNKKLDPIFIEIESFYDKEY